MSRAAEIARRTTETDIVLLLELDGAGEYDIDTGCGFFDHMLELFARHGSFDLTVRCKGDVQVDCHHTVEDVGIVLGQAFSQALGEMRGICRYGSFLLPMDEALIQVALDLSGRAHLSCGLDIASPRVGEFDTELAEEFLQALVRSLGMTLHVRQLAGKNAHHIIEGVFKGLARALAQAVSIDPRHERDIPSTKGLLK